MGREGHPASSGASALARPQPSRPARRETRTQPVPRLPPRPRGCPGRGKEETESPREEEEEEKEGKRREGFKVLSFGDEGLPSSNYVLSALPTWKAPSCSSNAPKGEELWGVREGRKGPRKQGIAILVLGQ